MDNSKRVEQIKEKLTYAFKPEKLEVLDESYKHVGHAGYKTGKGHFKVSIKSDELGSLSRIAAHKAIYQALGAMMEEDIHALSISIQK
ncbi:BolA family transcriptional regulator [Francisellaceae bacterium]|nr:BolA family transcriptional regulator [Francisellaceae bacterium]